MENPFIGKSEGSQEGETKSITTWATSQDKIADTVVEQSEINNELANQPGSGTCVSDSIAVVKKAVSKKAATSARNSLKNAQTKVFDNKYNHRNSAYRQARSFSNQSDISYGDSLFYSQPFNAQSQHETQAALSSVKQMTALNSDLKLGAYDFAATTKTGRQWISDIAAYLSVRSMAEHLLNQIAEQNATYMSAYRALRNQVRSVATPPVSTQFKDDKGQPLKQRSDQRLMAYGRSLHRKLKQIHAESNNKGISAKQIDAFNLYSISCPAYFEFIRSTGPSETPLFRELAYLESRELELTKRILDVKHNNQQLLAAITLSKQMTRTPR